jgi:SMC interacting uncharacterized protein involved in chromosome segregation
MKDEFDEYEIDAIFDVMQEADGIEARISALERIVRVMLEHSPKFKSAILKEMKRRSEAREEAMKEAIPLLKKIGGIS